MTRRTIHQILRGALAASLSAPAFVGVGCGGETHGSVSDVDGGRDASVDVGRDAAIDARRDSPVDAGPCRVLGSAPDAASCGNFQGATYDLPIEGNPSTCIVPNDAGETYEACETQCKSLNAFSCNVGTGDGGAYLHCMAECAVPGRRPSGLPQGPIRAGSRSREAGSAVGEHLARAAWFEAASVHAFTTLERELTAHGAPERLVRAARRAARDEVRHTKMTSSAARRFDGVPLAPEVPTREVRPLEALAVENAREGCVFETFSALVAMHQAETSEDPKLRTMFQVIAKDEQRHAALAWEVARWADTKLDAPARERVARAKRAALRSLSAETPREPTVAERELAGLPNAARRQRMARELARALA